jgi:hypothetical protein
LEVVASVSVAVDGALVARVDILASAGQSCFRSVRSVDSLVYIGFGQFVFLVDVRLGQVRRYPLNSYFGHLYDCGDLEHLDSHISVLATSASEVLAFDRTGDLIWKQSRYVSNRPLAAAFLTLANASAFEQPITAKS